MSGFKGVYWDTNGWYFQAAIQGFAERKAVAGRWDRIGRRARVAEIDPCGRVRHPKRDLSVRGRRPSTRLGLGRNAKMLLSSRSWLHGGHHPAFWDGRSYLVINAKPYKENDVIQSQVQGESVYLRIRQITRDSVTLLLNEAETTLKF